MRKSRLKYPFLWPLGGLLIAYVALRLRVCTVHPDWIAGLFASLSLVFFGLSNGYKFSVKKGLLRLTAVVVFHAGLGFFWFSRNNLDKAESLERVLRSSSPNARALVLVRDTWMYGPRGCRGSVQCIGISQEKERWKVCNVELRVRLNKKSGVPPALGYYWIDVNRIRLYDVPEIPGDPNWRNIMNGLGVAGYTFFDGDGSWLRIAKTAATSHVFYEIRSVCLIWLHESFYQYMSSPVAGLLYAMMVGDKSGLEDDINARFGAAGLLHVLAVSGMHVSLIMGALFWMLTGFGARGRPGLGILLVLLAAGWVYVFLTGAGASVMRAMISATWVWLGKYAFGRKQSLLHVLLGSAYLQWLITPTVVEQMGFQLSYLAVLGIAVIHPKAQDWAEGKSSWMRWTVENISLTLSATLFTLPLLLWQFQAFPTWFLLGNMVLLPLFSLSVYACMVAMLLGVLPLLGPAVYALLEGLMKGLLYLLQMMAQLPLPQIKALPMSGMDLFLLGVIVMFGLLLMMSQRPSTVTAVSSEQRPLKKFVHHKVRNPTQNLALYSKLKPNNKWTSPSAQNKMSFGPKSALQRGVFVLSYTKCLAMGMCLSFVGLVIHLEHARNQRKRRTEQFQFHCGSQVIRVEKRSTSMRLYADWQELHLQKKVWQKLQNYVSLGGIEDVAWINRLPLYHE